MKKRLLAALCALLCPVLLSGCWQAEPLEPGRPELLQPSQTPEEDPGPLLPARFSLPYAPDQTLDPVTCPDGMQQVAASLLCEGLFRLRPDFEPEPWLCAGYTANETQTAFTFTLRSGVVFSDGSPLTAADVRATLNRARTSPRYAARLAEISGVSADGDAVTVTLSTPNSALPALLDIPIVKAGTETDTPIGTGPYLLSQEDSGVYLVSNQTWWRGSPQPVDRIALVETADQDTKLYRFTSWDVQLITADLTGVSPISVTGDIDYQDTATTVFQYLGCNVSRQPLDDPAFRRLLWQSIDRERIVSAFLSGHGTAAQFPVSPVSPLYPTDLETVYSYEDLGAAVQNSGYTAERTLTLLVNSENSFKTAVAAYLAESFTAAGIPVAVKSLPWEEYAAALAAGNFDLYYGETRLSADWNASALLAAGGSLNYGGWTSEETDSLLAACGGSTDRAAALRRLCGHLQTQAPLIPLCFKSTTVLMQAHVVEDLTSTAALPFYGLEDCAIHLRND